ncbi:MAG: DUF448 domain-containing protein [Helicobacteraceae bacterium]|nr:DUF448 domain-containing protein [Helicobacteraceae bacterium]
MISYGSSFDYKRSRWYNPRPMSPIRMCVACRGRFEQKTLYRLQCADGRLIAYANSGRSFYLCANCITAPKISKQIARHCKKEVNTELIESLKETPA